MKRICSLILVIILMLSTVTSCSLGGLIETLEKVDESLTPEPTISKEVAYSVTKIAELLQRQRACMREFIIGTATEDVDFIEDVYRRTKEYDEEIKNKMAFIRDEIDTDAELLIAFDKACKRYEDVFPFVIEYMYEFAKGGQEIDDLYGLLRYYTPEISETMNAFDEFLELLLL